MFIPCCRVYSGMLLFSGTWPTQEDEIATQAITGTVSANLAWLFGKDHEEFLPYYELS